MSLAHPIGLEAGIELLCPGSHTLHEQLNRAFGMLGMFNKQLGALKCWEYFYRSLKCQVVWVSEEGMGNTFHLYALA